MTVVMNGCSNHSNNNKAKKNTTESQKPLTISVGAAVPTLDPGIVSDASSLRVLMDLDEGLVMYGLQGQMVPGIAKSWSVSQDGTVYTFHLRHDAKWSNGKSVTAQNFVYAFQRNLNPSTPNVFNTMFEAIKNAPAYLKGKIGADQLGVSAPDPWTFQITLSHPQPYFLKLMYLACTYPLYKPAIDKYGQDWAQPGTIVTDGPYNLKEWIPNGHLLAVKNPYYWDKAHVAIPQVKYLPIVDPTTEYSHFLAGDLDITWSIPTGKGFQYYKKKFGRQLIHNTMLANEYFWFNFKNPNFAKLSVRKALTMAVNRNILVTQVTKNGETPSYSVLPDGVQNSKYKSIYKHVPDYAWVDQNMSIRNATAKKLLQDAGYSAAHPLTFNVLYDTSPWKKNLVMAVIGMWQQAFGDMIDVTAENQEWKVFLQTTEGHHFDMALLDWKADYDDASDWVELVTCGSGNNYGQSCNMKTTNYFEQAVRQPTQAQAIPYMTKAIQAAMENYVILPLYNYSYNHLVSKRVGGMTAQDNTTNTFRTKWFYFKS